MDTSSEKPTIAGQAIIIPPDYSNYNRERRRMSTDNDVMRKFQNDFAEAPSLQEELAKQKLNNAGNLVHCSQCQGDIVIKKKAKRFGFMCPCRLSRLNVVEECPNCGTQLGNNKVST